MAGEGFGGLALVKGGPGTATHHFLAWDLTTETKLEMPVPEGNPSINEEEEVKHPNRGHRGAGLFPLTGEP